MEEVMRAISQYSNAMKITPETRLEELGMDSLETLDLLIQLGIPDTAVSDLQTVGDLVRHCETA
jgi:acyl carrier protein